MSCIGFMIVLRSAPGPLTHIDEETRRLALQVVVELLPNVRRIELTLTFVGLDVPDYQVKEVVTRAVRIASPLRDTAGLVVRGASNENAQRMRIM